MELQYKVINDPESFEVFRSLLKASNLPADDLNYKKDLLIGYYEGDSCRQGVAPGCPSASAWDVPKGNWWYLVARGEDTDLVVCAPECGPLGSFAYKQGCLRLAGSG